MLPNISPERGRWAAVFRRGGFVLRGRSKTEVRRSVWYGERAVLRRWSRTLERSLPEPPDPPPFRAAQEDDPW